MKLSIAMIAKDEEKNIEKSLEAISKLKGEIDYEIIVVDTGSSDNTINIARKYTEKVYEHKWNNDFAAMRNISLDYCTGDWVLVVDADEILEDRSELVSFLKSEKVELFNSAYVGIKNFTGKNKENYVYGVLVRMFKNDKNVRYKGSVHEQLQHKEPVYKTNINFLHNGYSSEDYELMIYKLKRNIKLLKEELKTVKGNDRIYTIYQLAKSYSMGNMKKEGLATIKEAYELTKNRKDGRVNTYVLQFYAQELFNVANYKMVIEVLEYAEKISECLDYYYMLSTSYTAIGEYTKAQKYFKKYFEVRKKRDKEPLEDVTLVESTYNLIDKVCQNKVVCDFEKKDYNSVVEYFEMIKDKDSISKVLDRYFYAVIKLGKIEKIEKYFEKEKVEDKHVDMILKILVNLEAEEEKVVFEKQLKRLSVIDEKIECYIESVYFKNDNNAYIEKMDFSTFNSWKSEVLKRQILKDYSKLNCIYEAPNENIESYLNSIVSNYEILKYVYEYSEDNFLCQDIEKLNYICEIERILVFNNSIEKEKFEKLVKRAFLNRINYINKMYTSEFVNSKNIKNMISKYDRFWLELIKIIPLASVDVLSYIRRLKELLNEIPEMKEVINIFIKKVNHEPVSDEMINEKKNLLKVVENYINEGKLDEATNILDYIEKIFPFDGDILNAQGVANFIKGDLNEALINLEMSSKLIKDNFDALYNLACVLESKQKINDARYYYNEALNICTNEQIKDEIKQILNN